MSAKTTTSHADIDGVVVGRIYIFKSKSDWRQGPESAVRAARDKLNYAHLSLDQRKKDYIEGAASSAEKSLQDSADIYLDFELRRSGELLVSVPTFRDADLLNASESFAHDEGGNDFRKWIADQAYFFLRDLSHHHQHHDRKIDTILILQPLSLGPILWRQRIVFSLHFHIISARRAKSSVGLIQAAGILAYCNAFLGICRKSLASDEDASKLAVFNEEALRQSLDAGAEELKLRLQLQANEAARITNFRIMTLAILAPVLALIGVAIQPNVGDPVKYPILNGVAGFISAHFVELLALCLIVFCFSWAFSGAIAIIGKSNSSRDLLRLGLVDERRSAAASLVLAGIFIGAAVYFSLPSIKPLLQALASYF